MDIKEALKLVHNASVFTQELVDNFSWETGKFKTSEQADLWIKSHKCLGYKTKKQTSSFGLIFCTAIKAKNN